MHVRVYKSFRDELVKIAGVSLDAGTRANLAGRQGKEYLPGGQLTSNDPGETNFVPKLAERKGIKRRMGKARGSFHKGYRKARKPAAAAAKGALYGSLLANILSGGRAARAGGFAGYTTPALLGAGAGLADYAAVGKKKKTAMVGSDTFTPGRALAQTRAVGSFQDKLIHKGDKLRPPTMGQRFSVPTMQDQ